MLLLFTKTCLIKIRNPDPRSGSMFAMNPVGSLYSFFGTPTKRPVTGRPVSKCPVTKCPFTRRPVTKRPDYKTS
jgi:hypothetical protein